jgi:hypothetical protein
MDAFLKGFTGEVIHSRSYRSPDLFKGKRVLVIGGGISGKHIVYDVAKKAQSATISSSRPITEVDLYKGNAFNKVRAVMTRSAIRMKPTPSFSKLPVGGKVEFTDGTVDCYDAIILCTGYKNEFAFLSNEVLSHYEPIVRFTSRSNSSNTKSILPTNNTSSMPHSQYLWLYNSVFPIPLLEDSDSTTPTLAFIGLMDVIDASVFPVAEAQAKWFAKLLSASATLPPLEIMRSETQSWIEKVDVTYHPMSIISTTKYIQDVAKSCTKYGSEG